MHVLVFGQHCDLVYEVRFREFRLGAAENMTPGGSQNRSSYVISHVFDGDSAIN